MYFYLFSPSEIFRAHPGLKGVAMAGGILIIIVVASITFYVVSARSKLRQHYKNLLLFCEFMEMLLRFSAAARVLPESCNLTINEWDNSKRFVHVHCTHRRHTHVHVHLVSFHPVIFYYNFFFLRLESEQLDSNVLSPGCRHQGWQSELRGGSGARKEVLENFSQHNIKKLHCTIIKSKGVKS